MDEEPTSPTGKSGVRRPMNAFLIFCKRHRTLVRERNPRLDNRSVTRILGELWAKLPLEEKSTYTSLANEYKQAFLKANPDYKWFNPEKNSAPTNRDKPSTRPSNSLTSYTGQIPHTDDNGPISPGGHATVTSAQLSSMIMENKGPGNPFSASLGNPQGAPLTAQGIPIFPIGMATQPAPLSVQQPVTSITPAITTIAMVAGQPVMVSQAPLMVSLPQQQLTPVPVSMVATNLPAGTINSTATSTSNLATNLTGNVLTMGSERATQSDKNVGLFELAQMCSSEHAKISNPGNKPQIPQMATFNAPVHNAIPMATGISSGAPGGASSGAPGGSAQEPKDKPRLDSKTLQGQVKEALGFQFGELGREKSQIQNPAGVNHILDYSLKKNKEAEMARSIESRLRQDAVKSLGVDVPSKPESIQLSKLVLDHVIEAMYSHEKNPSASPISTQQPQPVAPPPKSKFMLTVGEIQERVIRSAVVPSDQDMLRAKSNSQIGLNQLDVNLFKPRDNMKPATVVSDANKENKAANKVQVVEGSNENQKESQERKIEDCDMKIDIPIKKRKPRVKESIQTKSQEIPPQEPEAAERSEETPRSEDAPRGEDAPSSDDLDLDSNDLGDLDAGVRKSKRSNRGRRYQELIQQGYLQPARDKGRKGDEPLMIPHPVPHPMVTHTENHTDLVSNPTYDIAATNQRNLPETPQEGVAKETKIENEATGDSNPTEIPPGDDQAFRKRTYSETDIGNRRTRKRYKTGDFDLEAQIASLPICHIDEVARRGNKGKSLKIRHHSENSTLNKFAKPADINLLNVAELRGVLRPRSQSMSHASVGSARRKAPKMSIVRFIQAFRNPNASVVPLLSPKSSSCIPPWSDSFPSKSTAENKTEPSSTITSNSSIQASTKDIYSKTSPSSSSTIRSSVSEDKRPVTESSIEVPEDERGIQDSKMGQSSTVVPSTAVAPSATVPSTEKTDLLGKVTCVNVTAAVSELRFEKGSDNKTPALVTCQ